MIFVKETQCSGELGLGCILKKNRSLQDTLLEYQEREVLFRSTLINLCSILDAHSIQYEIDRSLLTEIKGLVPMEIAQPPIRTDSDSNKNRQSKGFFQ